VSDAAPAPSGAAPGAPPPADEDAAELATPKRRRWLVWTLIVIAAIIAFTACLTVWAKRQALDPDNWANTSAQLLADDEIRGAVSTYLVDQLFSNVDVAAQLSARLPENLKPIAAPLAGALEQAAFRTADAILARPRVQQLWKAANRRAVTAFTDLLDGETRGPVGVEQNELILDLRPLVNRLADEIGINPGRLKPDAGRIVVLQSDQIDTARRTVRAIRFLTVFFGLVVLALLAAAVWLAKGWRRVALRSVGLALLIVGVLVLVVRRVAGNQVVDALAGGGPNEKAANHAWFIATGLMRSLALALVVYGALIVIAAWLAGPTRFAVAVRRVLAPAFRRHTFLVYAVVVLVLLLVLLWGPSAGGRTFYGTLILFALILLGIWALRREVLREFPEDRGGAFSDAWDLVRRRGGGPPAPQAGA
jgi:hypothetical protein